MEHTGILERVGWEDEDKDLLTGKTNEEERERPSIKKKEQKECAQNSYKYDLKF